MHVGNKRKDILVLDESPTQGSDDTTITAEDKYPINLTRPGRTFLLSLYYNGGSSLLFVNAVKIYPFKVNTHCV